MDPVRISFCCGFVLGVALHVWVLGMRSLSTAEYCDCGERTYDGVCPLEAELGE